MNRYILSVNCGSSSLKFNLFEVIDSNKIETYMEGVFEEIGSPESSRLKYEFNGNKASFNKPVANHREALEIIFNEFSKYEIATNDICAVGHRVVHGGDKYTQSVLIDENIIQKIRELIPIAPLHNPPNLIGIEECMKLLPDIPHIAVFDTAFHSTIPEYAFRYAIPTKWYENYGVRKYGFHGTSHMYVSKRAAKLLNIPYNKFNCITAHLGNGSSITKIQNGKSVDTSMGFTPLQGVIMGTRSGDIDPGLITHVVNKLTEEGMNKEEAFESVMKSLNKESGLKALAETNMMQYIRERAIEGDTNAEEVISIYAYRVAQYIGAYMQTLPNVHAIVFTAGLGENEGYVRKKIISFLELSDISIDDKKNTIRKKEVIIGEANNDAKSPKVLVIPTDEEIVIGYDTLYLGCLNTDLPEIYPFEEA